MRVIRVTDIKGINKGLYKEGTIFIDEKEAHLLINGEVEPIQTEKPKLHLYIKKSELDKHLKKEYPELFIKKEEKEK